MFNVEELEVLELGDALGQLEELDEELVGRHGEGCGGWWLRSVVKYKESDERMESTFQKQRTIKISEWNRTRERLAWRFKNKMRREEKEK